MSGTKRLPSTLLKIAEIHEGNIQDMGDLTYFLIDGNPIHKVRIYGTVIERVDFPKTETSRKRTLLRIDDGTDTISLTVWSYPKVEDGVVVYDPIHMVEGVKLGDIVDVIGRVRDYQEEYYISPNSIGVKESIEWEIHRRTQLIQRELENKGLMVEERSVLEELEISSFSDNNSTAAEDPSQSVGDEILQLMSVDGKYSVEKIAEELNYSVEEIEPEINRLNAESFIVEIEPGIYQRLS